MKFGQNLPRNQVPEWASYYIDYKSLKKLIKTEAKALDAGGEPDLAGTVSLATMPASCHLTSPSRLLLHP